MNNFTKDELQIIHLDMCSYVARYPMLNESESHEQLRFKVKSMIDNYCDHTWTDGCGNYMVCYKCHLIGGRR